MGRRLGFALGLAALSGCSAELVELQVDVGNREAFLHASTFTFSAHAGREGLAPQDVCQTLLTELGGAGFSVEPLETFPSIEACDFRAGATVAALPTDEAYLVVAIRDDTNQLIMSGCEPSMLGSQRTPIVFVTATTRYYRNELEPGDPPFASIEERCGE